MNLKRKSRALVKLCKVTNGEVHNYKHESMFRKRSNVASYFKQDLPAISGHRISTIGGAYVALLLITGLATAAQPMRYAYMDTDWYKTQGVFAERERERKNLLEAQSIGVYVTNPTPYPAQVVVKKFSQGSAYPSLTKEKSIPAGATVEILDDALDQNYRYTLSGSLFKPTNAKTNQPLGMGFSTLQGPARIGVAGSSKPVPTVTFSQRISTNKDWSIQSPTSKKRELVLQLIEQKDKPILTIRDK